MSSREHRERLVREGFEAFNRGDAEAVLAVLDPAVESHVGPSLANTGTWHGHAGFLEMLRIWGEAFATQRNTVVSLSFPDDDHVIAETRQAGVGAGSGVPVEMPVYFLFEVPDELAVRVHLYADAEAAFAAAASE